jgi:replicative DNA helicase
MDPVTWAANVLDWHCLDPDGKIWKRRNPAEYDKWVNEHPGESVLGKSRYHRPYQAEMLRCSSNRKVFRLGRQSGKTDCLVVAMLFHLFIAPNVPENEGFRIVVIAPFQAQIDLIFNRIDELLSASALATNSIASRTKSPPRRLILYNGSILTGFTAGTKSGGNADSVRGQKANMLVLDEADYLNAGDLDSSLAIITNYPNATVWMSSTPKGTRDTFYNTCFKKDVLILTDIGLRAISVIEEGDLVLTSQGRYRQVVKCFRRDIDEEIYKLRFRHLNFSLSDCFVTGEHPYFTDNYWKRVKDLTTDDFVLIPTRKVFSDDRPEIKFLPLQPHEKRRLEIIRERGNRRKKVAEKFDTTERTISRIWSIARKYGENLAIYDKRKIKAHLKAEEFIKSNMVLSQDFYRLAGYYLAEGSIYRFNKRSYWAGIVFTFHSEEDEYIAEVVNLIKKIFGIIPVVRYERKNHKCSIILCRNWISIAFYSLFGHSENKSIPEFMLGKDNELELKKTLFAGDGGSNSYDIGKQILVLTAKQVILQVFDLCLRHKIPVSFFEQTERENRKPTYAISELSSKNKFNWWKFKNDDFYVRVQSVEKCHFNGEVYNIEVEEDNTYTAGLVAVHNCHSRAYKEFHYPAYVNPLWNDELEATFREQYTEIVYKHEALAEFGEQEEGVFQNVYVQKAKSPYLYGQYKYDSGWIYTMGVDWNDVRIGTNIVVVGFDPLSGHFYVVDRKVVSREGWQQITSCEKIAEMNQFWRPAFIYIDSGYGATNKEILRKYGYDCARDPEKGPNHPDSRLQDIVKDYNFGGKVEIHDLITKQPINKPSKPFLVENAVRRFETGTIHFPEDDDLLEKQLLGYIVDHVTSTGSPVYKATDEKIGDHTLDGLMLALVAFTLEKTDFGKPTYRIDFTFAGKFGEKTIPDSDGIGIIIKNDKKINPRDKNKPQLGRAEDLSGEEKSILTQKELPAAHANVGTDVKLWAWPGFEVDAPKPKMRSMGERKKMRTSKPARKNI